MVWLGQGPGNSFDSSIDIRRSRLMLSANKRHLNCRINDQVSSPCQRPGKIPTPLALDNVFSETWRKFMNLSKILPSEPQ